MRRDSKYFPFLLSDAMIQGITSKLLKAPYTPNICFFKLYLSHRSSFLSTISSKNFQFSNHFSQSKSKQTQFNSWKWVKQDTRKTIQLLPQRHYSTDTKNRETSELDFRQSLKSFLFRVHPDFFTGNTRVQQENDKSLKTLNNLLDIVEEYSKKPSGPIQLNAHSVPEQFAVSFYLRPPPKTLSKLKSEAHKDQIEPSDHEKAKEILNPTDQEFIHVKSQYTFVKQYFEQPFPREILERDVRIFFNDLLKQAGLPTMAVATTPEAEEFDEQFDDEGNYQPKDHQVRRPKGARATRIEFNNLLREFLDRHYPAEQLAVDKLGEDWDLWIGRKPEANIAMRIGELHSLTDREREQVHYAPDLNGQDRANGLLLLEYLWNDGHIPPDIPVYLSKEPNVFLDPVFLPGFISIPLEFEMDTFRQYLKDNLKTIMIKRYQMRSMIMETEFLIKQFTNVFQLVELNVRGPLEETHECLHGINEAVAPLLQDFKQYTEGMKWEVVDPRKMPKFSSLVHGSSSTPQDINTPLDPSMSELELSSDIMEEGVEDSSNQPRRVWEKSPFVVSNLEKQRPPTEVDVSSYGDNTILRMVDSNFPKGRSDIDQISEFNEKRSDIGPSSAQDSSLNSNHANTTDSHSFSGFPPHLSNDQPLNVNNPPQRKSMASFLDQAEEPAEPTSQSSLKYERAINWDLLKRGSEDHSIDNKSSTEYTDPAPQVHNKASTPSTSLSTSNGMRDDKSTQANLISDQASLEEAAKNLSPSPNLDPASNPKIGDDILLNTGETDEFTQDILKAAHSKQLVPMVGMPVYSFVTDTLSIPYNTSGESLYAWFVSNKVLLHFRKKLYPGKKQRKQLNEMLYKLKLLVGTKKIGFAGKPIWNFAMQLESCRRLHAYAELLRKSKIHTFSLVITQKTFSLNVQTRTIYIPYNFTPKGWYDFMMEMRQKKIVRKSSASRYWKV